VLTRSSWHTDIKPDNILFVEDRIIPDNPRDSWVHSKLEKDQNKFKLADPGFAKFVKKSPKEPCDVPRQHLQGGTETYGKCWSTG
jgi:serine/threonine protein kinase